MEYIKKIIISIICLLLISGCSASTDIVFSGETESNIVDIDYDSLMELMDKNDSFILYIGRPDCQDCREFEPILKEYLEDHGGSVYYLNIKSFRDDANKDDASEDEKEFYENLRDTLDFQWTPTLHFYRNGSIVSTYQYLDENYYNEENDKKREKIKNEFIKEFDNWMEKYIKQVK